MFNLSKLRLFEFSGTADGTILTKNFTDSQIAGNFIYIRSIKFNWYTGAGYWIIESAYDNKSMNVNTNTRYEVIHNQGLIEPKYVRVNGTASIELSINGVDQQLFLNGGSPPFDEINIDTITQDIIDTGLDFKVNASFYQDFELLTTGNPQVKIIMNCFVVSPQALKNIQANPVDLWRLNI